LQPNGNDCFGLYLDNDLNMYTAESDGYRALKWLSSSYEKYIIGSSTETWASLQNELDHPEGIFIDAHNNDVYVADTWNRRVQKWASNVTVAVIAYLPMDVPDDIQVDCYGKYFILALGHHTIRLFQSFATSGLDALVKVLIR
jgi:sugar lactone lactonase YvrE